eukprot:CAMPEP_0196784618 /NCGR_PEP_ID=MMETSP1104-20130614/17413_1 /TAXON_ID=33652 /ORGANISM="Cafeteria sp., Strain Caron Lab Isolate" /LENGTH=44 /DNA_ID= /DNA_START= /DNA_END= /DNA_ORIENTATION=
MEPRSPRVDEVHSFNASQQSLTIQPSTVGSASRAAPQFPAAPPA